MIEVFVQGGQWDADAYCFTDLPDYTIRLEHSLISLQKWEAYFHKPWISGEKKTLEETEYYYQCMCMDKNVPPEVFKYISDNDRMRINQYINDPHSAYTSYSSDDDEGSTKKRNQSLTAEEIYYFMIAFHIPAEYRKWHLNQLLNLIEVCSDKQKEANDRAKYGDKPKPLSAAGISKRKELNRIRRMKWNTTG